jgi:CRISPR/Cas system-associated exonuclease Cas4 (RecB family)
MPFHKKWQQEEELLTKGSRFTVSKSALEKFFSGCAFRYKLYREWNMKEDKLPPALKNGIDVHQAIEDALTGTGKITRDEAKRVVNWVEKNEYTILGTEVRHWAPLTDEIGLFGIIDAIAETRDGEVVLIDWKTANSQWTASRTKDGKLVTINAQSWQGPIYLTPPESSDIMKPSAWPTRMQYIVIPKSGAIGVWDYELTEPDRQQLITACNLLKHAADTGSFPKNKGWQCGRCDFKRVCWESPGWEKFYEKRTK